MQALTKGLLQNNSAQHACDNTNTQTTTDNMKSPFTSQLSRASSTLMARDLSTNSLMLPFINIFCFCHILSLESLEIHKMTTHVCEKSAKI